MSTEGKLSRIQRGWCWHWRHGHCTRYGAHVWNLDFPPQSMHYSNKKNLPAGNMKKCPNLSLKDVIRIYILLPLFTEKVAVLFSSSTFLKMSLRSTIFLGDLFGPLTWCSRACPPELHINNIQKWSLEDQRSPQKMIDFCSFFLVGKASDPVS